MRSQSSFTKAVIFAVSAVLQERLVMAANLSCPALTLQNGPDTCGGNLNCQCVDIRPMCGSTCDSGSTNAGGVDVCCNCCCSGGRHNGGGGNGGGGNSCGGSTDVEGDDIDIGVQNFFVNISNPFSTSPSVTVEKAHKDDDDDDDHEHHHNHHEYKDEVLLHNPDDLKPVPKHMHIKPKHHAPSLFSMGEADEDRSNWYTAYQKYRAPMVPYKPFAGLQQPVYSICEEIIDAPNSNGVFSGFIEVAQMPWKPAQVKGTFNIDTNFPDSFFFIKINENGLIGKDCDKVSHLKEYNPMIAVDEHGYSYPKQDPWIGRMEPIETTSDQSEISFDIPVLYQNMLGAESIIGRSLSIYDTKGTLDDEHDDELVGCCVLVQNEPPEFVKEGDWKYTPYPNKLKHHW